LRLFKDKHIAILEIGFGTGLNAIITALEIEKQGSIVQYTGVEKYPLKPVEVAQLDYMTALKRGDMQSKFNLMHSADWEQDIQVSPNFTLLKQQKDFSAITDKELYNLIYFDAFGARVQPELWTVTVFESMFKALKKDGYLVTYCAKGSVRRAMLAVGFLVERLPGPPGKREMLRAKKP